MSKVNKMENFKKKILEPTNNEYINNKMKILFKHNIFEYGNEFYMTVNIFSLETNAQNVLI